MGEWDLYCAICGALGHRPWWEQDDEDGYDPAVANESDTQWMDDILIIGENAASSSLDKVFLSGRAYGPEYGAYQVEPGEDSNFPVGVTSIPVYAREDAAGLAFPFHNACFELFKHFHFRKPIDKEALYRAMKRLVGKEYQATLAIDYGTISQCQDQYWIVSRGQETFVSLPTAIPRLTDYYQHLPTLPASRPRPTTSEDRAPQNDIFATIELSIVLAIISELDIPSLNCLRAASISVSKIPLGPQFWKRRLRQDQPWLYDIPRNQENDNVDWARAYEQLLRSSEESFGSKVHGLVNRRRIWNVCSQISKPYLQEKKKRDDAAAAVPQTLEHALSTASRELIAPLPKSSEVSRVILAANYHDISSVEPTLGVCWNSRGELGGLVVQSAEDDRPGEQMEMDAESKFARIHRAKVDKSKWLVGFVTVSREEPRQDRDQEVRRHVHGVKLLFSDGSSSLFGEQEGDFRLFTVESDHFLVGIHFEAHEGTISKLALIQQPLHRLPEDARQRVLNRHADHPIDSPHTTCLWKNALPSKSLEISEFKAGYWSYEMKPDICSMESLVFGETEEELADITAVLADVLLGGFEVRYASREPRKIGPRCQAMKMLSIDGAGGERIVSITASVSHIPAAISFATNRSRQMIIGHAWSAEPAKWPPNPGEGADMALAGFYGYWSDRDLDTARLDAIGAFLARGSPCENQDLARDSHRFPWETYPPPEGWVEFGTIFGQREAQGGGLGARMVSYPESGTVVMWLDCSRSIASIDLTFCHGTRAQQIPLVSLDVRYVDGSSRTLGPGAFAAESEGGRGGDSPPWCWCHFGFKRDGEVGVTPHYRHETWDVGGRRIGLLRLWLHDGMLTGLQFETENGTASPQWGYATEEDKLEEIKLGTDADESSLGLKLFFGDNHRQTTRDDSVVVAVQGLRASNKSAK